MSDSFRDWHDGDAPLRGRDVAGTFRYLRDSLLSIQSLGLVAEGIADVELSDDERQFRLITSSGTPLAWLDLPPAPWQWRDEGWTAGATYREGDAFFVDSSGSSYLVLVDHVSAADLATDVAAHRVTLLARGGSNGEDAPVAGPTPYDIRFSRRGPLSDGANLHYEVLARAITIPKQLPGSIVRNGFGSRAVRIRLARNGTEFASWLFPAGQTEGLLAVFPAADIACAPGDLITARMTFETSDAPGTLIGTPETALFGTIAAHVT